MKIIFSIVLILGTLNTLAQPDVIHQWAKSIGSSGIDNSYSIAVDDSGNVYITGFFQDTVDFDPGAGTANLTSTGFDDIFFAKYDNSGSYLWANRIGGIANENFSHSIALDSSGNVYITGYFTGIADFDPGTGTVNLTSTASQDIFFAKYDNSGNYVWAKSIEGSGSGGNTGKCILVDGSGNVYIGGRFWDIVDFDPDTGIANLSSAGSSDIFFAKYDNSGNYLWAKRVGSDMGGDMIYSMAMDGSGNMYITGYFIDTADFNPGVGIADLVSAGDRDIFLAKYDNNGNYIWAKNIGGTTNDYGLSIAVDDSSNPYITGFFENSADFDPSAGTANLIAAGGRDIFLAKYDSGGNYIWANSIGGLSMNEGNGIAIDNDGNIYITGYFEGTADFDPDTGAAKLTSSGFDDILFAKYDNSGNYLWAKGIGSSGSTGDIGNSITVDGFGNVYITGYFSDTSDFDPGPDTSNLISVGSGDIFFAKYSQCNSVASFSQTATMICSGGFVSFTNMSTGANIFEWQEDGIPFSTATDTARIFNTPGTYIISLIADSGTCSDSSGITITVNPTYATALSDTICNGDSILVGGAYQIAQGTYYDSLTTSTGCDSVLTTALTVNSLPTIDLGPDTVICSGCSIMLDAGTGFTNYNWTIGASSQNILVDSAGTYIVEVTDTNGCVSSDTMVINIASGTNQSTISNHQSLFIYPNPTTGRFTLEMNLQVETKLSIKLYHVNGQLIYSEEISNFKGAFEKQLDLSKHSGGIYYVKIVTDKGLIIRKIAYQ